MVRLKEVESERKEPRLLPVGLVTVAAAEAVAQAGDIAVAAVVVVVVLDRHFEALLPTFPPRHRTRQRFPA